MTAIHAEPLRESVQRALIEAHVAEGNWVEARRDYAAYRELARRELGVEPSPELTALVQQPSAADSSAVTSGRRVATVGTATG